jgi:HEAT repeat protein
MAVSSLADALGDEQELVRTAAVSALGHLGPSAVPAIPALVTILRGEGKDGDDPWIRGTAASVLAEIGPDAQEAVPDLLDCLGGSNDDRTTIRLRLHVARALWRIQTEPRFLLSLALKSLEDPDWRVRRFAAQLLGDLGPAGQAALPHLRQALHDDHLAVRRQASSSLDSIVDEGRRCSAVHRHQQTGSIASDGRAVIDE